LIVVLACRCRLLEAGYTVRAIVRSTSDPDKTAHLEACAAAVGASDRLELFQGDLLKSGEYDEAFAGADAVVHTAAVVAIRGKNPEKEIVEPSIRGTQNMLDSADKSGSVRRIIHTSSVAAVQSYDHSPEYRFTEEDEATWSTVARGDPYGYAKLGAERLVRNHAGAGGKAPYDSVSINPVRHLSNTHKKPLQSLFALARGPS
jgi:dihydroflavonol-4-reductase